VVSEPYECNTLLTATFSKTYSEDTHQCSYKDYRTLNRWKANRDLLSVFTYCNLLFVMTHLRQGKKVSILLSGDVNPRPISSRRGLLEDSPYHAAGAAIRRTTSHDRVPRASRDLGMSYDHFRKT
jgi:hypothetical protein